MHITEKKTAIQHLMDYDFLILLSNSREMSNTDFNKEFARKITNETGIKHFVIGDLPNSIVSMIDLPDNTSLQVWNNTRSIITTIYRSISEKLALSEIPPKLTNFYAILSYRNRSETICFGSPRNQSEQETDFYPFSYVKIRARRYYFQCFQITEQNFEH